MAARITDDEWDELTPENFDTTALLVQSMPWTCCAAI